LPIRCCSSALIGIIKPKWWANLGSSRVPYLLCCLIEL
jgi:hypothetical protein